MIQRPGYRDRIVKALGRSKVTAILGPRQCGKTTLAKVIAEEYSAHFLDLESPADQAKLQNPELYLIRLTGLIIIDEIQQMPELFQVLRVLADKSSDNGRFLILGSASPDVIKNTSETLAGRVEFVDLRGFDISETGSDAINELWLRGGFPLSFLSRNEEDSIAWREGFVRTFLQRDIPQLGINIPAQTMRRFWTMLAHSHGQILNSSRLAGSMGMSDKTIRSYVDILEGTYMLRSLQPWYENVKKRQVKSPKIYLNDTGLLHHLLGIKNMDELLGHPAAGSSWESFVIEQILRVEPLLSPFFWSAYSGAEVDLFIVLGGERTGVEIKFTESPKTTKSMHSAVNELQLKKLYVIYPGSERFPLNSKIEACPLPDFLEQINRG